ncbi:MAG TPA: hypothetical protein VM260_02680 [Pirellula sp.]|nr:hypothetical protein [Pirellula sp.]
MTSNEQIPLRSQFPFNGQPIDGKSLRRLAFATWFAASTIMSGCQQLGVRARDEDLTQMMAEQDDWALPQSPQSRVPRPSVNDFKTQNRRDKPISLTAENRFNSNERRAKPSQTAVVGYGPSSDGPSENDQTTIINSPHQEIDIEGALATVPAAYREVLRKQLNAVRQQAGAIATNARTQAKTSPMEMHSLSDGTSQNHDQARSNFEKTSNRSNHAETQQLASDPSPASSISIRLTDAGVQNRDSVSTAFSMEPVTNSATTTSAPATSLPTIHASASVHAPLDSTTRIVQASSDSPIASPVSTPNLSGNAYSPSSPSSWRQLLTQAIEQLEKKVKETPASDDNLRISQEVTLRMLYASQRRLEDAVRPIDKLSENEQEYFRHQMHALYEASNPEAMPVRSRHWSLVMNSQREATNHLAAASNLEVKSVAFCTEVERYGVITKFPKYQFQADQELLLYCEIENVAANKVKEGFESQLQGSYEIMDSQGRKVADQLLPMEPEVCQNHRRDYFIVYKIFMPPLIAAGNYQLRLTVEDMKAHKFGQSHLDFQIKK